MTNAHPESIAQFAVYLQFYRCFWGVGGREKIVGEKDGKGGLEMIS